MQRPWSNKAEGKREARRQTAPVQHAPPDVAGVAHGQIAGRASRLLQRQPISGDKERRMHCIHLEDRLLVRGGVSR